MTSAAIRQTILTFSEKVNRLQSSSLLQFMTSQGWKLDWNFETERPGDQALVPEVEHLEAYILNLRFFVQDNEPTSLRNMAALYNRAGDWAISSPVENRAKNDASDTANNLCILVKHARRNVNGMEIHEVNAPSKGASWRRGNP
jgi:hypothetical protein